MFVSFFPVIILIKTYLLVSVKGLDCEHIQCSHVHDPVCGFSKATDGSEALNKYHNVCYLKKARCLLKPQVDLHQVEEVLCDLEPKIKSTRRLTDFSIVGAHQVCNHTCPTFCVDTHEPACAQIWKKRMRSELKPMINHCHIDMFSCVMGVNVTILPLNSCYKNPSALLFMTQVAGMKSLGLIQQAYVVEDKRIPYLGPSSYFSSRRQNIEKVPVLGLFKNKYVKHPDERLDDIYRNILWRDTVTNSRRRSRRT